MFTISANTRAGHSDTRPAKTRTQRGQGVEKLLAIVGEGQRDAGGGGENADAVAGLEMADDKALPGGAHRHEVAYGHAEVVEVQCDIASLRHDGRRRRGIFSRGWASRRDGRRGRCGQRFHGKRGDDLRLAVVEQLKVALLQAGNGLAPGVADNDTELHKIGLTADGDFRRRNVGAAVQLDFVVGEALCAQDDDGKQGEST